LKEKYHNRVLFLALINACEVYDCAINQNSTHINEKHNIDNHKGFVDLARDSRKKGAYCVRQSNYKAIKEHLQSEFETRVTNIVLLSKNHDSGA